ncbi:DPY30 domain-containing protein 1 [Elysia marginata]|uniref:DPY30 domain-containing protein 1 n=1 Tax=Elysia marginata TaxID=1093978 RepID=A0AAV4EJ93_9GAST|nr:DPY30 domain-containing protein 1 [Elysia marginata]
MIMMSIMMLMTFLGSKNASGGKSRVRLVCSRHLKHSIARSQKPEMEAKYLKNNLGCLTSCLKEVAEKRPHDPIEYIAFWLRKHVENARLKAKKEEEAKQLQKEQEEEALDRERRAKRLEEARRLSEEEAARRKAEEERKAREAASASKLPVVEEKEEPDVDAAAPPAEPAEAEVSGETAAVKTLAQRSGGTGSIPSRVKPRTLKLVLVADPPGV